MVPAGSIVFPALGQKINNPAHHAYNFRWLWALGDNFEPGIRNPEPGERSELT
jgi:hypothetical protein